MRFHSSETKGILTDLDREWIFLLREAKELGISKKEIRKFLQKEKKIN